MSIGIQDSLKVARSLSQLVTQTTNVIVRKRVRRHLIQKLRKRTNDAVKKASASTFVKQTEKTENDIVRELSPMFVRQIESAALAMMDLSEDKLATELNTKTYKSVLDSAETLASLVFNPADWDEELINRVLPPLAVGMAESAATQMLLLTGGESARKGIKSPPPGHPFYGNQWTGGGADWRSMSYSDVKKNASHLSEDEQMELLRSESDNDSVVTALAFIGGSEKTRLAAANVLKEKHPRDYKDWERNSPDAWARNGKEEFIRRFINVHRGDSRSIATAHMQNIMSEVGPNKGTDAPHFFGNGVVPPTPSSKIVGWMNEEYNRSQELLTKSEYKLHRGTNTKAGLPMESWSPSKSTAQQFSRQGGRRQGGEVRSATIPKKFIFGTYETIRGWDESTVKGKKEHIVLGSGFAASQRGKSLQSDIKSPPPGHPFYGNQWTGGAGGGSGSFQGKPYDPSAWTTAGKYQRPDGRWTKERHELHKQIIEDVLAGATPVDNPAAYMMGGGTASGKSTVRKSGLTDIPKNIVNIDTDDLKARLPEYKEMMSKGNSKAASLTHDESSYLSKKILKEATKRGYNTMLDGTGDSSLHSLKKKIDKMRATGNKVHATYATVPVDVALARNKARGRATGRYVPSSYVLHSHASVSNVVPQAIKNGFFDTFKLVDTSSKTPQLIASARGTHLVVHDADKWAEFIGKGG